MLSEAELEGAQGTQRDYMMDTVVFLRMDGSLTDEYNMPDPDFNPVLTTVAGVKIIPQGEARGSAQVPLVDAVIRLPLEVKSQFLPTDRVQLTHRYGQVLSVQPIFEIVGLPSEGPTGLVLNLKRANTL